MSQLVLGLGWKNFIIRNWAPFFVAGCACQLLRERRSAPRWALFLVASAFAGNASAGGVDFARLAQVTAAALLMPAIVAMECPLVQAVALGWLRLGRSWLVVQAGALSYPRYLLHKEIGYRVIRGLGPVEPALLLLTAVLVVLAVAAAVVYFEPRLQARLRQALRLRQASNISTGHSL